MSFNETEIEIKLQIDKKEFVLFKKKLSLETTRISKSHQSDLYYIPIKKKGYVDTEKYPYKWIRLRKQNSKSFLTFKHHFPEGLKQYSYSKEYETEINNIEVLELVFKELDYSYTIKVDKDRELFNYRDEFEISFDVVNNLGLFIEIESIKDFGDANETKNMIYKFIDKFNLNNCKIIDVGYPFLINKKAANKQYKKLGRKW